MTVKVRPIQRRSDDSNASEMVTYFGLDSEILGSKSIAMKYDVIPPHKKTDDHPVSHPVESAIFMIKGKLRFFAEKQDGSIYSFEVKANDFIYVPADEAHYAENETDESAEAIVGIPAPKFAN